MPYSELDTAMSPLGTEGNITSLPGSKNRWGKIHSRILDKHQDMGTDQISIARHELTLMNNCSWLIQPAIITDKSVNGKS